MFSEATPKRALKKSSSVQAVINYFLSLGGEKIKVRVSNTFKGNAFPQFKEIIIEATPP